MVNGHIKIKKIVSSLTNTHVIPNPFDVWFLYKKISCKILVTTYLIIISIIIIFCVQQKKEFHTGLEQQEGE